jgi:hypothetical protein
MKNSSLIAETDFLDQLGKFVEQLYGAFRRRDQVRWFEVYLRGLLLTTGRKMTSTLAQSSKFAENLNRKDNAQALRHLSLHMRPERLGPCR